MLRNYKGVDKMRSRNTGKKFKAEALQNQVVSRFSIITVLNHMKLFDEIRGLVTDTVPPQLTAINTDY